MALTQERLDELDRIAQARRGGTPTVQPKTTTPVKQAPVVTAAPVQKTAPVQVPKTQVEKPMAIPQSTSQEAPKSFVGKVFNILQKPLAAVGGYADAKVKDQEQQMKSGVNPYGNFGINELKAEVAGVKGIIPGIKNDTYPSVALQGIADRTPGPIVKKIASSGITKFAADTLADPTNAIPIEAGAKILSKVPGVKQAIEGTGKAVRAIKEIPAVKSATTELALRFTKEKVVPKGVLTAFDEVGNKFRQQAPKVAEDVRKIYEGLDNKEVEAVADALNLKPLNKGKKTFKGYKEIVAKVGKEAWDTRVVPAIEATQAIYKRELDDQLKRKIISKADYTDRLSKPYYHAMGIEKNKVSQAIDKIMGKYGQSFRGYNKQKKGVLEMTGRLDKNAAKSTVTRELRQLHDNLIDDAMVKIRTEFGKRTGSKGGVPEGWITVDADKLTGANRRLKGYYFPPEVAKHINQVYTKTPELLKTIDAVNKAWKPFVTQFNPKYFLNNVLGNISNSHIAGMVDPKRYKQALIGGFSKSEQELLQHSGVIDSGGTLNEISGKFDDFLTDSKGSMLNYLKTKKGTKTGPFQLMSELGQRLENNGRGALFLDTYEKMLKMGENADDAMRLAKEHVNKHLFDYRNGLTPFETRYMKKLIPFYTFARKNIPLQIENLYKRTGKVNQQIRAVAALNGGQLPSDEGLTVPYTNDEQGNKRRLKLALPVNDVLDPKAGEDTIVKGQLRKATNMMSPYIKAGIEGVRSIGADANPTDWFTGKEITNKEKPASQRALDWLSYLLPKQTSGARSYEKIKENPSTKNIFESLFIPGIVKKPRKDQAILDAIYKKKDQDRFRRDQLLKR